MVTLDRRRSWTCLYSHTTDKQTSPLGELAVQTVGGSLRKLPSATGWLHCKLLMMSLINTAGNLSLNYGNIEEHADAALASSCCLG